MPAGSLAVVGCGIQYQHHMTAQAERFIREADKLFYVIPGPWADTWMTSLNGTAESLAPLYGDNKRRIDTYGHMVDRILKPVYEGLHVCAVFYGHPGVFVTPSHEAIRRAKADGIFAIMLPGISAEDYLFAELGIDPAVRGCQSFEATDFLVRNRLFDPTSHLVIWQVGVIGHVGVRATENRAGLHLLVDVLAAKYGKEHEVTIYEGAPHHDYRSRIEPMPLHELPHARMMSITTLYVPPLPDWPLDAERMARIGLTKRDIERRW